MALSASDAAHFLRRVGFAGTTEEIDHFTGREIADVVDEVLSINPTLPAQPAAATSSDLWWECKVATIDWWCDRMAAASWVDRTAATPSPLVEKMALFWHSHFACGTGKIREFASLWRQLAITWRDGLGDFEVLTRNVAPSGPLLMYFDNHTNVVGNEQENFARELMELHTVGVGHYTEADVIAMARAWTGHGIVGNVGNRFDVSYRFDRSQHDTSQKTLLGIQRNWDGPEAITELVKGSTREACARFLATKLWRYFVDDYPDAQVVGDVAAAMMADDMRVKAAVRAILVHPRFWAPDARWAVVRPPMEFAVDCLRRFDIPADQTLLAQASWVMGQHLFSPPAVNGWGTHSYWISTTAVWGKARFLRSLRTHPNVEASFGEFNTLSRNAAASRIVDRLGITEPSPATMNRLKGWFDDIVANQRWAASKDALLIGALTPEFQLA